jgi:hypothetical protein
MEESQMASAPAGEEAQHDPEIEELLKFEPVPRKRIVEGCWTPELQREFIARLAVHGSPGRACEEMGKDLTGMMKLYRSPLAASFRAAWHGAIALAKRRQAERTAAQYVEPGTRAPTIDHRRKHPHANPLPRAGEGEVLNEYGECEDEASYLQRAEDAKDSIGRKLLRARRLFLQEISACHGKRAAFEILTELPVDWDKAKRGEPQPDEPYRSTNQRQPDMLLTAESGWSMGEIGYGPDKIAQLRASIDEHRASEGLEPVDWESEGTDRSDANSPSPPSGGVGRERGPR